MNFVLSILFSSFAVMVVVLIPWIGVGALDLKTLFGVVIPYAALVTFIVGIIVRVLGWGRSPVPYRIPTTAGQMWSFPWIKSNPIDNPKGTGGVVLRMLFEVLTFRSLFRNTRLEYSKVDGAPRINYEWEKWLWLAAIHGGGHLVVTQKNPLFPDPLSVTSRRLFSADADSDPWFYRHADALLVAG